MSILVLFSGGVDSTVLLTQALLEQRLGLSLWYRYTHPAAAAEYRAKAAIYLHFERQGLALTDAELAPPLFGLDRADLGSGVVGPRVIPARNQVFVSIAVAMASARGMDEVWIGAQADDASDYPDCRPGWVETMDSLAQAWGVRVRAPLLGMSRQEVRALGASIGAPLDLCSSCYQPRNGAPCGGCNSCRQDLT